MEFIFITVVVLGVIVLALILVARAYPGSGADLVDWRPTRSAELEAQLEEDDVQQMIEAQNEYRRRRGAKELTEEEVQEWAAKDEKVRVEARESLERKLDALDDEYDKLNDELGS